MPTYPGSAATVFAIAFAIQQLIEYIDVFTFRTEEARRSVYRLPLLKGIALAAGVLAAWTCDACQPSIDGVSNTFLVKAVVALALAGGTEGANSLLKFAQYAKDRTRAEAEVTRTRQFVLHAATERNQ